MLISRRKLLSAAAAAGPAAFATKAARAGYAQQLLSSTRSEFSPAAVGGITPVSGSGAYGALATLGTASFDYDMVLLELLNNGQNTRSRISLTVNNSGADEPLISDLFWDTTTSASPLAMYSTGIVCPVTVARGSIIKAQTWANSGTNNVNIALTGFQGDARMVKGGRAIVSATDFSGIDPTNSITLSGTTTTGWVVVQAASPVRYSALYGCFDGRGSTITVAYTRFDLGFGPPGGPYQAIGSFRHVNQNYVSPTIKGPFPCDIPAGSNIVVRGTADRADTEVVSVVVCGLAA